VNGELSVEQRAMVADLIGLTGADPVLTESHNWAGYSHQALYEGVHDQNDPGAAAQLAAEWATTSAGMLDASLSMIGIVKGSADGWEGEAAEATRKALGGLADWGANTAAISLRISKRLSEQAEIMAEAKAAMPEPVQFDVAAEVAKVNSQPTMAGFVQSLNDFHAGHARMTVAHDEAVAVMAWMEERSRSVDQAIPVFAAPPEMVARKAYRPNDSAGTVPSERDSLGLRRETQVPLVAQQGAPAGRLSQSAPIAQGQGMPMPGGDGTPPASFTPLAASTGPASLPSGSVPPGGVDPNAFRARQGTSPSSVLSGGWQPQSIPPTGTSTVRIPSPPKPGGVHGSTSISGFGPTGLPPGGTDLPRPHVSGPGNRLPDVPYPPPGVPRGFGPQGSGGSGGSGPNGPGPIGPGATGRGIPPVGSGPGGGPGGMGPGGGDPARGGVPARGAGMTGAVPPGAAQPGPAQGARFGGSPAALGSGAMPPGMGGMGGGRGQGAEDKERSSAYRIDDDLFEVPGADLPPSVIGGKKPKQDEP
jgi:hypothetical protein